MDRLSLYITGTDTGAGKTAVSCALLRGLRRAGVDAVGMKPLASGCSWRNHRWENEDALALLAEGPADLDYALVNPLALPDATAPEIAAERNGIEVTLAPMRAAHARLAERAECVLVEGVGGWMAPLSDTLMQADLAGELGVQQVVLVVGLRLGCINHALLSLRAIRADGFQVVGWIGSALDPELAFAEAYRQRLKRRLDVPCLGLLEHGESLLDPGLLQATLGLTAPAAGAG